MNEPLISEEWITSPAERHDALRFVSEETPCPYLSGRQSRSEVYRADGLEPAAYERLLGLGFRRSGRIVYRPRCRECHECRQLRVVVGSFVRTRSMNRVWRMNRDVGVALDDPEATEEKYDLFVRYLNAQHDGTMGRTRDALAGFLYDSPTDTVELTYRIGRRLIGVSIADRVPAGLSSVYMFFDPAFARRSLGTFSILWEIEFVRREGLAYYYLGYYVPESQTMAYKVRFRPNEMLAGERHWLGLRD